MNDEQPIVFAYWVNGELKGFRADTFGTISDKYPKIYHYSKKQVDIVLNNTKASMNKSGTDFMKKIFNIGTLVNGDANEALNQVSNTENQIQNWGEFELRVHPFIGYEGEWDYPEQWKIQAEINNLQDAIEIYKFKMIENGN